VLAEVDMAQDYERFSEPRLHREAGARGVCVGCDCTGRQVRGCVCGLRLHGEAGARGVCVGRDCTREAVCAGCVCGPRLHGEAGARGVCVGCDCTGRQVRRGVCVGCGLTPGEAGARGPPRPESAPRCLPRTHARARRARC